MKTFFTNIISMIMSALIFVGSIIGIPSMPKGNKVDMSKFELTFSDEFNGKKLDRTKWTPHLGSDEKNTVMRHGGYWNLSMAEVKDGCLTIRTKYLKNGVNKGDPAGWYSCALDTSEFFSQKYGYFEIRCKNPVGVGQWSAFWLLNWEMGNVTGNGENGAEIDILESAFSGKSFLRNRISHCVHYDGYAFPDHKSTIARQYLTHNNPYTEFNTYSVEWNEDEYIFYINGVESYRTDFGGTSKKPEFMILSVEVGGADGKPGKSWAGKPFDTMGMDYQSEFVIDYVRAYQYKDKTAEASQTSAEFFSLF
ncbi:MAG: family 16 glycosylhydrolase [Acutalibacteraceae bacterium]